MTHVPHTNPDSQMKLLLASSKNWEYPKVKD